MALEDPQLTHNASRFVAVDKVDSPLAYEYVSCCLLFEHERLLGESSSESKRNDPTAWAVGLKEVLSAIRVF